MMTRRYFLAVPAIARFARAESPLRVLVVTGGHSFDQDAFFALFGGMQNASVTHTRFKDGAEEKLTPAARKQYDVMLFYDMHQEPKPHWDSWMQLLAEGMPSVFLHHALGSYRKMAAYQDIVGGHAQFTATIVPGEISTFWKHDEILNVHVADKNHPITQGLADFTIQDECYKGYYVRPDVHVLLTTDHPDNGCILSWTHRFKNSPVVYLQLGHDAKAYENPSFRRLLERSLRWAAGRLER